MKKHIPLDSTIKELDDMMSRVNGLEASSTDDYQKATVSVLKTDLELAPLVFFTDTDPRLSYGMRLGVTMGVSALRIRRIMPWAGLGLVTEYLFANSHRPHLVALRGGARVGFDWDF